MNTTTKTFSTLNDNDKKRYMKYVAHQMTMKLLQNDDAYNTMYAKYLSTLKIDEIIVNINKKLIDEQNVKSKRKSNDDIFDAMLKSSKSL